MAIHPAIESYSFTKQVNGTINVVFNCYLGVDVTFNPSNPGDPHSIDLSYSETTINRNATVPNSHPYNFNSANEFILEFNTTETSTGNVTIKRPRIHVED